MVKAKQKKQGFVLVLSLVVMFVLSGILLLRLELVSVNKLRNKLLIHQIKKEVNQHNKSLTVSN